MYFDLLKVLAELALATFIGDGYLYGAIGFILAQIGFDSAITVAGVLVALFIGLMQVIIATQQKGIAQQQQAVSSAQGELQAVSGWLTYLQHPDWNTRYATVIALGQIGKEATLAPLAIALTDNTEMVRDEAATALSRVVTGEAVNEERAIQIVVGMLRNEDPAIRNAATEALTRISQRGGNRYTDNVVQAINDATPEIGAAPAREATAPITIKPPSR